MEDRFQADIEQPVNIPEPVLEPITEAIPEPSKQMSIKDAIKDAFARGRDPQTGKFVAGADKPADKPSTEATPTPDKPVSKATQDQTPDTAKPKGAPQRWSSENKAIWDSLPASIQAEVHKTEADNSRGFEKFKQQYQAYDQVKAKLEPTLNRLNMQFPDFVQGAAGWMMALTGPQRVQAAQHFLKNLGIDPATVAGVPLQQPTGTQSQFPPEIGQYLQSTAQRLDQFEQYFNAQQQNSTAAWIENWAKDKPHYQTVRQEMGKLIGAGQFINAESGHPDLDAAYNYAIWGNPEVRALLQQEEAAKQQQVRKQVVQQARRASQSLPVASPGAPPKPNGQMQNQETVSQSIRRAMRELSA
jgi:hypothetical protein